MKPFRICKFLSPTWKNALSQIICNSFELNWNNEKWLGINPTATICVNDKKHVINQIPPPFASPKLQVYHVLVILQKSIYVLRNKEAFPYALTPLCGYYSSTQQSLETEACMPPRESVGENGRKHNHTNTILLKRIRNPLIILGVLLYAT